MKNRPITKLIFQLKKVDISGYETSFVEKSLLNRISETNCASESEYCTYIEQNLNEADLFLNTLSVGYSEFFRNSLSFSVLEKILLNNILSKKGKSNRKEIRVWSAACSKGQEAYSLAMLLKEFKGVTGEDTNFRIFATDCNEEVVNEARKGHFRADELENLTGKRLKKWFCKKGDIYTVKPELKQNIDFSVFDLTNADQAAPPASIFGNFDLVICANILFYYNSKSRKAILEKIKQTLNKDGYFMTGETERSLLMMENMEEVYSQSSIFRPLK